jgi:hypothetical protein
MTRPSAPLPQKFIWSSRMSVQIDFNKLLHEFKMNMDPGRLHLRKPPLSDHEKSQRIIDIYNFMDEIGFPFFLYFYNIVVGNLEIAETSNVEIQQAINKNKEGIRRLADAQNEILKKCFPSEKSGDPLNFERLQQCSMHFAKGNLKSSVMNSGDVWIVLIIFFKAVSILGLKKSLKLEIILIESAIINFSLINNRRRGNFLSRID